MLPEFDEDLIDDDIEEEDEPTRTYQMHIDDEIVAGKTDALDAMKQAVYKILNTERYAYIIYSWDYGVELKDLFGKPKNYCIPEIERRIREALLNDERITAVGNFSFEQPDRHTIATTFTVETVFGDFDTETEVSI